MTRRKTSVEGPHPVDAHVGAHLKKLRTERRLSQEALGAKVGLTYQQIQKYEVARNRVSASMLAELAVALDVPPTSFFEGLENWR